jgi:nucleoside-diphosphate-sugar epimerase
MKVVVTGASGFIGRHVLNALLAIDVEIYAITRDINKLANIDKSINVVEYVIGDNDKNIFDEIGLPDVLIHLAWDGLPNYKSLHHFETELPKQYNFLKSAIDSGLNSLFVTGTCFEYGMQSGELSVDMDAKPNNPYGFAKNTLRQQLEFLQIDKQFNFTWARLFYIYGESQSSSSLYTKLKEAVLRKDKIFNMSGGRQIRDYLPVKEVAHQIVYLALAKSNLGVMNICSGKPISVHEQVEEWLYDNNWEIQLNLGYYEYPDYEPMNFWGTKTF